MFDLNISLLVLATLSVVAALLWLASGLLKRVGCKHERYQQEGADLASCVRCGKVLGSMEYMRAQRPGDEVKP